MLPTPRIATTPRRPIPLAAQRSVRTQLFSPPASTRCLISLASALLILIAGCTKQSGGVVDPSGVPLFLVNAAVYPDTVRMATLPQSNGILTVTVRAQATVIRQTGSTDIASISVGVYAAGTTDPFLTVQLHDDGISPDSVAGDAVYSTQVQFTIPRSAAGVFLLRFMATDRLGFASNSVESPLVMLRDSHAPVLSNLVAPDTVVVPVDGSTNFQMTIRATDPDGQADISQVFFRSLDSSDPTQRYILKNDGSAPGSVAGDSTYAIVVTVQDNPTVRKTYRFAFQGVNALGDTSASLLHSITIR